MAYEAKMKTGGNLHSYLGHFAGKDVLQKGHNDMPTFGGGGKVTPQFNATVNPIAATRQANRQNLAATKQAGGNVALQRTQDRTAMNLAKQQRKARNQAGFRASDRAARLNTIGAANAATKTNRMTARAAKKAPIQSARQGFRSARTTLQSARTNLRNDVQSGNTSRITQDFQAKQAARGAKRSARQSVASALKGAR